MSSRRSNLGPINRKLKRSSVERFPGIAPAPAAYRSPLRSTGPIISEGTAIRPSVIGISPGLNPGLGTGYKRSAVRQATVVQAIQTPPVYEVTQTPEVIQAITTPPHVYEIVQPIVQVTPDIVTQRKVERVTLPPPTIIPRKARGARGVYEEVRTQDYCSVCPWWLCLLLALLLPLALLSGLVFAFRDQLGLTGKNRQGDRQLGPTNATGGKPLIPGAPIEKQIDSVTITNITCQSGYFFNKNKCIACPRGSLWKGGVCIKKVLVEQPADKRKQTETQRETSTEQARSSEAQWNTNISAEEEVNIDKRWAVITPKVTSITENDGANTATTNEKSEASTMQNNQDEQSNPQDTRQKGQGNRVQRIETTKSATTATTLSSSTSTPKTSNKGDKTQTVSESESSQSSTSTSSPSESTGSPGQQSNSSSNPGPQSKDQSSSSGSKERNEEERRHRHLNQPR